jgi:hypothetical protein
MHVRYTVTLNDFVVFNLYITRKSGVGRSAYFILWLGLPILFALGALQAVQFSREIAALAFVILAVFWLCFFPFRYRDALARNARTFVKKLGGRGIIGERGLILSEELLVAISETFRTEARWENMTGVDVVGEYTYIFLTGISALILPRRGFDSDSEYEAVRDFVLRKLARRESPDPSEGNR